MEVQQIKKLGRELKKFLNKFADCFARSEPREHLRTYVQGQLSDLPRKSIEPMALAAGVTPRTLQNFVAQLLWDGPRRRDHVQWIVAREHAHPQAIGIVNESGNPKKGQPTAGVQRPWCGNTGKRDNGVVGVHPGYVAGDCHGLLDSDLYLPQDWAEDPVRRREVGIPEEVVFRSKPAIALEQIRRALGNGVRVAAWTFDEFYGRGQEFLDGLRERGQNFVGEVPCDATGWRREPQVLPHPGPRRRPKGGPARRYPRLARQSLPAREVRHLAVYSPVFRQQPGPQFRIKAGQKGPIVWEVKHAAFYRQQGRAGLPGPADTLLVARNVLDPQEIKYFLSNLVPDGQAVTREWLLGVGFCRSPLERCFEIAKSELGMDHFERRSWRGIHRHGYLTQVSQLFCARVQQREKKRAAASGPDGRTSSSGGLRLGAGPGIPVVRQNPRVRTRGRADPVLPAEKPLGAYFALETNVAQTPDAWNRYPRTEVLYTG